MAVQVKDLRIGYNMLNKSLLPIMKKMKEWDPEAHSEELCKLEKAYPLETYSELQLCTQFKRLTGESAQDVLSIVGIEENKGALRQLVHLTIAQANLLGMPQGQALQDKLQHEEVRLSKTIVKDDDEDMEIDEKDPIKQPGQIDEATMVTKDGNPGLQTQTQTDEEDEDVLWQDTFVPEPEEESIESDNSQDELPAIDYITQHRDDDDEY
ncbi:unnamed protein product [Mytilus coruscus]|uniref:Uncharacterized protein n=1 Tax=Mytilus coruscus TaxID=42192 RepID=A0A6J8ARK0_MYTCO|nr:unnamed protein product [Mytilus coruscus]